MTPRWNNRHVHDTAALLRAEGRLVRLATLLTIDAWRGVDSHVRYSKNGLHVRRISGPDGTHAGRAH
jgi:hypothetical protein